MPGQLSELRNCFEYLRKNYYIIYVKESKCECVNPKLHGSASCRIGHICFDMKQAFLNDRIGFYHKPIVTKIGRRRYANSKFWRDFVYEGLSAHV